MRLSRKAAGVVAIGGVAALGIGLIGSGGIGAAFTDSATANASIDVGTFGCALSSPDISPDTDGNLTITLPTITSSAPNKQTAQVTVENTGSMRLIVTSRITTDGAIFDSGAVTPIPLEQGLAIAPNNHRTYTIGAQWTPLGNSDLGTSGTVTYKFSCLEPAQSSHPNITFDTTYGGTAQWADNGDMILDSPASGIITDFGSTLPNAEPSFTTDVSNTGLPAPEFDIHFTNGKQLIGWAHDAWMISNVDSTGQPWSHIQTETAGWTVASVDILAGGSGTTYTISCLNYDGTNYVGSGTCTWS